MKEKIKYGENLGNFQSKKTQKTQIPYITNKT